MAGGDAAGSPRDEAELQAEQRLAPRASASPAPSAPAPVASAEAGLEAGALENAARAHAAGFRIARSTPGARIESMLPLGTSIRTEPGSELAIDLANGARIQVEPGTRALLLAAEPATLLLISGSLHAQLLPQGAAAGRSALRIVSHAFTAAVPVAGELWIAADEVGAHAVSAGARTAPGAAEPQGAPADATKPARTGYAAFLSVLSGDVAVERLAGGPEGGIGVYVLHGGQLLVHPMAAVVAGPRTLEAAWEVYGRSQKKRLPPLQPPAEGASSEPALERALAALEEIEASSSALLLAQREAKQREDKPRVQALQKELVQSAQRKLAARQRVRLAYELACVRLMRAADPGPEARTAFEARFAGRAALALAGGL